MRLRDSLTVAPAAGTAYTVPAAVYFLDTANRRDRAADTPGAPDLLVTKIRAIVRGLPDEFDPAADRFDWRGRSLWLDGEPLPRMRGGRVHHYTLNLTTEDPTS